MTLPRPSYLSNTKASGGPPPGKGFYHATVVRVESYQIVSFAADAVLGAAEEDTARSFSADAILGSRFEATPKPDVYVKIPRLSGEFEYGPIEYVGSVPSVGDSVFVGFKEGRRDELVAITAGGESLGSSIDVNIESLTDQDVISYNEETGLWENISIALLTGDYLPLAGGTMYGAIEMTNTFGDFAGVIYALNTSGRDVLFIDASTSEGGEDGVRIALLGPGDPTAPGNIIITGQDDALLAQWNETSDQWEFHATVDLQGNILQNTADPTTDDHVGDRGYNDARYVEITGDTMTGGLQIDMDAPSLILDRTLITSGTSLLGFETDNVSYGQLGMPELGSNSLHLTDLSGQLYVESLVSGGPGVVTIRTSDGSGGTQTRWVVSGDTGDITFYDNSGGVVFQWDESDNQIEFSTTVDLQENVLENPLDPTSDDHVGDRGYNDLRYAPYLHAASHSHTGYDEIDVANLAAFGEEGWMLERDGFGGLRWVLTSTLGGISAAAFTIRVAASNARSESKAAADSICDGTDDHVEIQAALTVCGSLGFGRVVLSEGEFKCGLDEIVVPANVSLVGVGMYDTILYNDSGASGIMITLGGDNIVIKDLSIEDTYSGGCNT